MKLMKYHPLYWRQYLVNMQIDDVVNCRTDLLTFTKTMFKARKGVNMKENHHQVIICEALEKVVVGNILRLIITVPPRSGKTEFSVINFIAWCMGNFPDSEFIHPSYSARLAANNTYQARDIIRHEVYNEIFDNVHINNDSNARNEFRTKQGGVVYATGTAGTITGYGAGKMRPGFGGCIIIDDPHKAGEANSYLMRQNVIDWFSTTLESRKNDNINTPIILIMQRLHDNDLAGFLLGGGNGEKWHHVNIPAINNDGESFWPEQFPIEDLRRLEASDSYRFAGQYLQNPRVLGGNIIKGEWFNYYNQLPILEYRAIYADTAMKTSERNDYSVLECWGKGKDGKIYLIDILRGKFEAPELERRTIAFWNKHLALSDQNNGQLRYLKVEDKASGTGLIQKIKSIVDPSIPIIGIPRTVDKYTRVVDILGYIESGYICLPENAPYVNDFISECESFTSNDTHSYDDQLDPMIDAIKDMITSNNSMNVWSNLGRK